MKNVVAALIVCSVVALAGTEATAQSFLAPAPQVVYRPALPTYSYPSVVVNRPAFFAAPVVTQSPIVTQAPIAAQEPIVAEASAAPHYASPDSATVVTQYAPAAPGPAVIAGPTQVFASPPVVTYRPALPLYRQPIVTYRQPVVTYRQPVVTYAAPATYVAPATYAAPALNGYGVPVAQPVIISPKVYYPGQPVRNLLRAITP